MKFHFIDLRVHTTTTHRSDTSTRNIWNNVQCTMHTTPISKGRIAPHECLKSVGKYKWIEHHNCNALQFKKPFYICNFSSLMSLNLWNTVRRDGSPALLWVSIMLFSECLSLHRRNRFFIQWISLMKLWGDNENDMKTGYSTLHRLVAVGSSCKILHCQGWSSIRGTRIACEAKWYWKYQYVNV